MKQMIPRTFHGLMEAGAVAHAGAVAVGAAIGLHHNNAAAIALDHTSLVSSHGDAEEGKVVAKNQQLALVDVTAESQGFLTEARDSLKPTLGYSHSDQWTVAGFVNSLTVPRTPGRLTPMLQTMSIYLTNHPTLEVAARNITAARATALQGDLEAAKNGVLAQKAALKTLRALRRQKAGAMYLRLAQLAEETGRLISSTDSRWLQLGLNIPGAKEIPDVPENVELLLVGTNALSVKWGAAARAGHYRVWKKVVGVDEEMIPVGSPADLDFLFESLPANGTVEIAVSAVNDGGESAKSAVVSITL